MSNASVRTLATLPPLTLIPMPSELPQLTLTVSYTDMIIADEPNDCRQNNAAHVTTMK